MAKADIGPKIGIEGEAQFKRELQSIQTGLKTLGSEMKVVTSEFAGNEKSTEALTAKNEVLEATVVQLTQKQKLLYEQMQKSASAYGSADTRTQKLTQQYNETTAQINMMNAEIKKNSTQIDNNGTAFGKLGSALGDYTDKLGLGNTALGKMTSSLSNGTMAATAFSAAVIKLAADLVKLSNAAAQHGDQVATLATKYNMTAQSIQQFQYMAELTDVSVETITGSLSKLTRNMDSARDGTGSAAQEFAQLGVSVTNSGGSLRSANEVFAEAIDALGRVGNETERDALAMSLFGKSAMELNPLIKQGADGIKELADEAANSGYVMSDKMVAVLHEGDDATQRLDKAMDGLKNTIGAGVTPIVAGWKTILADAANDMAVFIQQLAGMRDGADEVSASMQNMSKAISSVRDVTADELWNESKWGKIEQEIANRQDLIKNYPGGRMTVYVGDNSPGRVVETNPSKINVSVNLDGYTLGQAVTPLVNSRNVQRGNAF